ncbi:hypothetical protein PILCRDRAFT_413222 [Piloderma croceum F 1598]|uniref:Uncharacterized protein n=1 Tax=Piloderma croceum (strain F 1598) TaxID=765440 RepID=A0A0C3BBU4_PILCF|nr:hypothetical protein PILCRDRAFT_413222 [Piloderma croceum F 1598]
MIPSEKGSVFGEFWYVTSQKIQIFSSRVGDYVSVLPQASEQALGQQIDSATRCKSLYDSRTSI